ncbi:MAG: hypothetical protein ACE5G7_02740 [Candidatus Hydrothermarchaeaceae archaeon]
MARVKVKDGICGHTTVITTKKLDRNTVEVRITSPCEMVKKLGEELSEVEWKGVFARDLGDSLVYKAAAKHIKHAGCPVPSAIIRAIEVDLEMAPAKDISIEVEK